MTLIRRLNCFDAPKIKKMISYLGDNEKISKTLSNEAFGLIHGILPLKYKFLPESYILLEKKEILGLITVVPTSGNPYKINITRLIFQQNMYDVGKSRKQMRKQILDTARTRILSRLHNYITTN